MKKNLWLILGLSFSTSLLAQQLTNPAPAAPIQPAAAETNSAAPAAPKAAEKKAPRKTAKKAAAKKTASAPALKTVPLIPGPASVAGSNVNVRGQARLRSEIVMRITKGQEVTVVEEIVRNDSADDEPSAWAKILLPAGATVWAHSSYLSNNVVAANALNLRSGPGENYSILGRVSRGTEVKTVSTKESWTQIEAPAGAYGFVASQYLKQEAPPIIAAAPPMPAETPAVPVIPEAPATQQSVTDAPVVAPAPGDVPVPASAPASTNVAAVTPPAVEPAVVAGADTNAVPEEPMEEPLPKRVVQREGIVRGTGSIQAPTHFALVSPFNGKLINYLYSNSETLDLRRYKGFRIIVTGEEAIEERWGNTPVITIQELQLVEE